MGGNREKVMKLRQVAGTIKELKQLLPAFGCIAVKWAVHWEPKHLIVSMPTYVIFIL